MDFVRAGGSPVRGEAWLRPTGQAMSIEVKLPNMGDGIDHGDVVRVLVKPGDTVAENQGIAELETDKALVEVPSSSAGLVEAVLIKEGDRVPIGGVMIRVSSNGSAPKDAALAATPASAPAATVEVETAPASEPTPAVQRTLNAAQANGQASVIASDGIIPAGPATRRLARELGIDLRRVAATGPHGRITKEDVQNFASSGKAAAQGGAALSIALPPLPDFSKWGPVERKAMSKVRRMTAEHMSHCWRVVPHVTQFEYPDITELDALRKRQADGVAQSGGKLTNTVFMLKAVVSCLKAYPDFNATLDDAAGEIIYKRHYHIGIAVDTDRGLLVPVLRDVDKKDIPALARELGELSEKARSGKIDVEDLRGATFTISNQGGIGGAEFTPIVNWPEVAILAMGRARPQPAVLPDGVTIAPRLILPLGLSYDHRVIDGAMAARFVAHLRDLLEQPEKLLMGL